jgi:hypothetical protein
VNTRFKHSDVANNNIQVAQKKKRWSKEETELLALTEARMLLDGPVRRINQCLAERMKLQGRTLESIKSARKRQDYRDLVSRYLADLRNQGPSRTSGPNVEVAPPQALSEGVPAVISVNRSYECEPERSVYLKAIEKILPEARKTTSFHALDLVNAAEDLLRGELSSPEQLTWLDAVFPNKSLKPKSARNAVIVDPRLPKWRQRRREFAATQKLFKSNMGRAAKTILDGKKEARMPSLEAMKGYWQPIFSGSSPEDPPEVESRGERRELRWLADPVTPEEVEMTSIPPSSAPGIDGVTPRLWRIVPNVARALYFNMTIAL